MNKEDTSSPTVAVESLMLSCTIDAEEPRDVATADIPDACWIIMQRISTEK